MNIIFICHDGLASQSTYHVLSIAEQLSCLGHDCVACIPKSMNDCDVGIRPTSISILTFKDARDGKIQFVNRGGPTLIHCWTPREQVKNLALYLSSRYECPYFVHLEDNEREILNRELRDISYEKLVRLPPSEQSKYIANAAIRIHPHEHWEFLRESTGCTVLIDKLAEHVPTGIPVRLFWPGYDDCFSGQFPDRRDILRHKFGIPESSFVVLYSGAFHDINKEEIYRMLIVLKVLFNRGMPLIFVKTGSNQFPDLLRDGIDSGWIRDLGFLPRNELPDIYALSDTLIQPGCSDPFNDYRFPSKLPEALISGIPIILPYSNLGRYMKDKEEALVTRDYSMDSLIDQITYLFDHPAERFKIGRNGQAFCREHLDWKQASLKIHGFYEACLTGTREDLIRTGQIQVEKTDNLTRSSSTLPCDGTGNFSAPVEPHEICRIFRKDINHDKEEAISTCGFATGLSILERKYKRNKRRLCRYRLISIAELGVILLLLLIIIYLK